MWMLLQLADSAFPTGGFAHSHGLEAAAQAGEVSDLRQFAAEIVWQAGYGALPFIRAAHGGERDVSALDERADAFLVNHVANRASRMQGRALWSTCAKVFPNRLPTLPKIHMHLAPLWGAACGALGLSLDDAQQVFLFAAARGVLSAAVRLGLAGTHEGQAILAGLAPLLDEVQRQCGGLDLDALAQPAPLIDLLQGAHDRLYSRLFQS